MLTQGLINHQHVPLGSVELTPRRVRHLYFLAPSAAGRRTSGLDTVDAFEIPSHLRAVVDEEKPVDRTVCGIRYPL